MTTKTTKAATKSKKATSADDVSNLPKLPVMLEVLQFLRTAKGSNDKSIHAMLDKAFVECKKNDTVLMLERIMLHIGDVSRQHNLLKEMNIKSPTGGAQERAIFRSCMRWWEKNLPESFAKNLHVFVEFTLYENLMYYQNRTDRKTGNVLGTEILLPAHKEVWSFLATQIRKGKDLNLIARHLPKYYAENSVNRTTKKTVHLKKGQTEFKYKIPNKSWVKINGNYVEGPTVTLKEGDVISYPRQKQSVSLERQKYINKWISGFCKVMGWSIDDYRKFRSTQSTPEQAFASKSISKISEVDFGKFLDRLTSGQRFRVAKMLAYKDGNNLVAREKWGKLGSWYINWENNQEKIANELRKAAAEGDTEKTKTLMKDFKVKATGLQTIDMLAEILKGQLNNTQIDNTYQAMIEKMDLIANVFPIIDGSGSMSREIDNGGHKITYRSVAYAMAIAFSTRNPVDKFRNTYGWFSDRFDICGRSAFKNTAPNKFVDSKQFTKSVPEYQFISAEKSFTENLAAMKSADKEEYSCTNMFSNIEFFVGLVKEGMYSVEELPVALLYITDNERNAGRSPKEAVNLAASIGWHPLQIFWGISEMPQSAKAELKTVPNALFVGGFNESALSQILRGIKSGAINPETELWSIYNDERYSVLTGA